MMFLYIQEKQSNSNGQPFKSNKYPYLHLLTLLCSSKLMDEKVPKIGEKRTGAGM
jgi:hypothetical protein